MNGPIDDDFDEYLQRGSSVSQHYRALESEEVPPEIDAAVLSRASDAVRAPLANQRRAWRRWTVPVALAASTVLAISVVLESGVRDEFAVTDAPQSVSIEQQASEAAPTSDGSVPPEQVPLAPGSADTVSPPVEAPGLEARERSNAIERRQESVRGQKERTAEPRVPTAPAAPPKAEPAAERVEEIAVTGTAARPNLEREIESSASDSERAAPTDLHRSMRAVTQRGVAPPPPAEQAARDAAAPSPAQSQETTVTGGTLGQLAADNAQDAVDPEAWLIRIRELREQGKSAAADREWQAFRRAFPEYPVADDDRAAPE